MSAVIVRGLAPARGWLVVDISTGVVVSHQERRRHAQWSARRRGYRVTAPWRVR